MSATEDIRGDIAPSKEVGEAVELEFEDGETVYGNVEIVERGTAVDDWPGVGETVTFKSVGGPVEKTVKAIEKDRENPIQLDHGGWYTRTNFEEYTRQQKYRIIRTQDGREIWPSLDDDGTEKE